MARIPSSTALVCALALAGCLNPTEQKEPSKLAAYVVSAGGAACAAHADEAGCAADAANGCTWLARAVDCPAGTTCPSGGCFQQDPCTAFADRAACAADARCAWSEVELLCPLYSDCAGGGFCHAKAEDGSGCACVSPVACPRDAECPPMECDCAGGAGGTSGGSCTCACAACEPGQSCPPCACDCSGGGADSGCVEAGTCACACAPCAPGETCPPCDCACAPAGEAVSTGTSGSGEASGSSTASCACPDCPAGEACPPCTCDGGPAPDLCEAHADAESCAADAACVWYAMGVPCREGESCRGGICQLAPQDGGGDTGCACACPAIACAQGEECVPPPCTCSCGTGASGGCAPGATTAPAPEPSDPAAPDEPSQGGGSSGG